MKSLGVSIPELVSGAVETVLEADVDTFKSTVPGPQGIQGEDGRNIHHLIHEYSELPDHTIVKGIGRGDGNEAEVTSGVPGNKDTYSAYADEEENTHVGYITIQNGDSAYAYAVDGGFTGTQEEFISLLGQIDDLVDAGNNAVTQSEAARDKAKKWAEEVEDTEVEPGKYSALHHAAKALASENSASTSETNASNSASAASNSASSAHDSEVNAGNSASDALVSEQHSKTSEDNSKVSENNSKTSEDNASTSESNALASENKAEKWATEAVGTEVEAGKYSAMHYAYNANVDKMVWKGQWAAGTYEKNDVVMYGTNNYIVLVSSTDEEPTTGTDWEVSMVGAVPTYDFSIDGTNIVISSNGVVQFPATDKEW